MVLFPLFIICGRFNALATEVLLSPPSSCTRKAHYLLTKSMASLSPSLSLSSWNITHIKKSRALCKRTSLIFQCRWSLDCILCIAFSHLALWLFLILYYPYQIFFTARHWKRGEDKDDSLTNNRTCIFRKRPNDQNNHDVTLRLLMVFPLVAWWPVCQTYLPTGLLRRSISASKVSNWLLYWCCFFFCLCISSFLAIFIPPLHLFQPYTTS